MWSSHYGATLPVETSPRRAGGRRVYAHYGRPRAGGRARTGPGGATTTVLSGGSKSNIFALSSGRRAEAAINRNLWDSSCRRKT